VLQERSFVLQERSAQSQEVAIKALQQALEQAKALGGGGGGGGGDGGGAIIALADAEAMARAAVAEYRKVHSFDPFARMHPVRPATPSEGSSRSGGASSPTASAKDSKEQRRAFKASVAEFYGLSCEDPHKLVDMLGVQRPFQEVELAHVWPASYQDFGPYAREMALPADFHLKQRNFLLLPKDLHQAFDTARVCFIPCSAGVRVRVLQAEGLSASVLALDGTLLHLPLAAADSTRVPYKRVLGWMAWLAKGRRTLAPQAEQDMSEAMGASGSAEGNAALKTLVASYERSGYRSGTV